MATFVFAGYLLVISVYRLTMFKKITEKEKKSTNIENINQLPAGSSSDEFSKQLVTALYTKRGFKEALKNLNEAATQTGFNGGRDVESTIKMLFFSTFVEDLYGRSTLEELGIDETEVLPEIKIEEARYRTIFLDYISHDKEFWPKLLKLDEANIRHAFRAIETQEGVEELIPKIVEARK